MSTDIEGAMAVVNMNLSLAVSKEDDLAVRRPLDVGQHQSLQLLTPDTIAINRPYNHCTWETEEKRRQHEREGIRGTREVLVCINQTRSQDLCAFVECCLATKSLNFNNTSGIDNGCGSGLLGVTANK